MDETGRILASNIKRISIRNIFFPIILIIFCFIFLSIIPSGSLGNPHFTKNNKDVLDAYSKDIDFIHCAFSTLYYSNFDFYKGDDIAGHYYYSLDDDSCIFVLLPASDFNQKTAPPVLNNVSFSAKLEKNEDSFNTFIAQFAEDIGWDTAGVSNISAPFTIDKFTKSTIWYYIIFVITLIVMFASFVFIALSILYILRPKFHPSFTVLKHVFKIDRSEYFAIEKELIMDTTHQIGSVYITKDYIIECGHFSIDVVPLSKIFWMYSFTHAQPGIDPKRPLTYSLCVYTDPYHRFIFHYKTLDFANEVCEYIKGINPNIVTEYSQELHEKAEFIRKHH